MSKQENINNNIRKKRMNLKLSLFNVSFHYDLSFLLRVPHLNNMFSESDQPPTPLSPRLVVYTHVFRLENYVLCIVMLNIANGHIVFFLFFFFFSDYDTYISQDLVAIANTFFAIATRISQTSYSNQKSMTQ